MYEEQVLQILMRVGERGISAALLAKHVYNQNCTFFAQPDLQDIRQQVWQYLQRNSRSPHSLIEHTGRHGYYRLNTQGSSDARQLMLNFSNPQPAADDLAAEKPVQDLSLSLFGDDEAN